MSKLSGSEQLADLKKQRDELIVISTVTKKELREQIKAQIQAELDKQQKENEDKLVLKKLEDKIRKMAAVATAEQRKLDARRTIIVGRTVIKYLTDSNNQLDKSNFKQKLLDTITRESDKEIIEAADFFSETDDKDTEPKAKDTEAVVISAEDTKAEAEVNGTEAKSEDTETETLSQINTDNIKLSLEEINELDRIVGQDEPLTDETEEELERKYENNQWRN